MTAATQQVNEFIWKAGRIANIDFCGNFKRLQEKEPKTAALLLGHFEDEGFQTQDSDYTYIIYHSQYGYSVGRKKKPVPDTSMEEKPLSKTPQSAEIVTDGLSFTPSEIKILKDLAAAITELIKVKH